MAQDSKVASSDKGFTVGQLIKELEKLPKNRKVYYQFDVGTYFPNMQSFEITEIEISKKGRLILS